MTIRRVRPITVRIACVQLAAHPARESERALDEALAGIDAAARSGADLAVLPESTYPGYVLLRRSLPNGAALVEHAVRSITLAARSAGIAVCIGLARYDSTGRLRNEATYFDRRGNEIARYAKIFLWNFDSQWFAPGNSLQPFDTEFGRIGMMICADGRMPEIARTLAARGAWLVLDPTAWVAFGGSYESMRNPQVDYMMRARAKENGIWIAAADKCGSEHRAVHYVGHSMIVAPDGSVVAEAGAQARSLVIADASKRRTRPFVAALSASERRVLQRVSVSRKYGGRAPAFRLGILQGPVRGHRAEAVSALRAQGVDAIVDTAAGAAALRTALRKVRGLRVAVVPKRRMFAPEPARAAALDGADVIVWTEPPRDPMLRDFARTRALENKVYVIVCARASDPSSACVIDPAGSVRAEALTGIPSGFVAFIDTRDARDKCVVPGTDAFSARTVREFALVSGAFS
jgi:predicted amidohydrolase